MLQFAAAYGFRNIQNLVQKLKRKKCPYHYVEVMACPSGVLTCHGIGCDPCYEMSGCINGGGQIRPQDGTSSKEHCAKADAIYSSIRYIHTGVFLGGGGGGGGGIRPPLRILCPPLEIPPKKIVLE